MFDIIFTKDFKNDLEHYTKKKKYKNIFDDIDPVIDDLEKGNLIGDEISEVHINKECAIKVRAANSDMNVGKSNGYRIIYYAVKNDCEIYLLTIYSKKDDNRIPTNKKIMELVCKYCLNE